MVKMSGARVYAEALKDHEVEYLFGLSGGEDLLCLETASAGIKYVLTRDERCAVWMAEGYAKTSFKPGIVSVSPMAIPHVVNGLADPYNARIPVIVITWDFDPAKEKEKNPSHGSTEFCPGLLSAVTKKFLYFQEPERLPDYINLAFKTATTGIPGPVAIMTPITLHEAVVDVKFKQEPRYNHYPAIRVAPDPELIEKAAELLIKAERPVIFSGDTVIWGGTLIQVFGAWDELRELAELLVAPVASNKGVLADNHPLNAGIPGYYNGGEFGRGALANKLLREADLVLMVCAKTSHCNTCDYTAPPIGTRIIQIEPDPVEIGRNYPIEVGIVGDPKLALRKLIDIIKGKMAKRELETHPRVKEIQRFMREWRKRTSVESDSDEVPIQPARLMKEINGFIDEETIVGVGGGMSLLFANNYIDVLSHGIHYLTFAGGFGQIGTGLPMALGAKLGAPDKRVIYIDGDASFGYNVMELETAARLDIPVVAVVLNNSAIYWEEYFASEIGGDAYERELYRQLYCFSDVNYGKIAEVMGCYGVRVERPGELKDALDGAIKSNKPAVVDVRTKKPTKEEYSRLSLAL